MNETITKRKQIPVFINGIEHLVHEMEVDRFADIIDDLIVIFQLIPIEEYKDLDKASFATKLPGLFRKFLKNKELYPALKRVLLNLAGIDSDVDSLSFLEVLRLAVAVLKVNDLAEIKERFFELRELLTTMATEDMTVTTG